VHEILFYKKKLVVVDFFRNERDPAKRKETFQRLLK